MLELHPHDMAHGGEAVARHDGKAYFVPGAMPGEVVTASVVEDKGSWARTALVDVVVPAEDRRQPPCPHANVCGGCQWQHAADATQREWKRTIVESQLRHLGKLDAPIVHPTVVAGDPFGYRNRMDFRVVDGRPALFRSRSSDLVALSQCLLLVPELAALFERLGDLDGADSVTLRAGTKTGDLVVVVEGEVPSHADTWGASVVQRDGTRLRTLIGDGKLTEIVGGSLFDLAPDGFFQNNTEGAEALVRLVGDALDVADDEVLLDGYCGVGLFGATVGSDAERVVGIDASKQSIALAHTNLERAGVDHAVVAGRFAKDIEAIEEYWDVAVVDPPRKGLGSRGVEAVTATMPRRVVYVACDPASLARDVRSFNEFGYDFVDATPVDMFPQTFHIEIVATFDRQPLGSDD